MFCVISRTLVGGVLPLCRKAVGVFNSSSPLRKDCLVSYSRHSLGEFYPSAEMQSVCSAAPVDWATTKMGILVQVNKCIISILFDLWNSSNKSDLNSFFVFIACKHSLVVIVWDYRIQCSMFKILFPVSNTYGIYLVSLGNLV